MKRAKKIGKVLGYGFGGLCIILLLIQAFLLRGTPGKTLKATDYRPKIHYTNIPTLLIPGWGGNTITYRRLINYYQDQHVAQKVMTVWVSPQNRIRVKGSWHGQKNALIQVLFDWNYSPTYHPQVKQLRHVLRYLNSHYHINKVNVVAHSYGGTEFIHAYMGARDLQANLRLNKIIFLGVPVEESLSDHLPYRYLLIRHSTDKNFQQLYWQVKNWQLNYPIQLYNLMGSKTGSRITDGSVPHIQSEMLRALIKAQPLVNYHQRIYSKTTHTQLHDRLVILNYIERVLWEEQD